MIPTCKFSLRNIIEGFADFKDRKIGSAGFYLEPSGEPIEHSACMTNARLGPLFANRIQIAVNESVIELLQWKYIPRDSDDNPMYYVHVNLRQILFYNKHYEILDAIKTFIPRVSLKLNYLTIHLYRKCKLAVNCISSESLDEYIEYGGKADDLCMIISPGYRFVGVTSPKEEALYKLHQLKCKTLQVYLHEFAERCTKTINDWLWYADNVPFQIKLTVIVVHSDLDDRKTPNINSLVSHKNLDAFQLYDKHKLLYSYNRTELLEFRRLITRFQKTKAPNHPLTDKNIQSIIKSYLIG